MIFGLRPASSDGRVVGVRGRSHFFESVSNVPATAAAGAFGVMLPTTLDNLVRGGASGSFPLAPPPG